MDLNLLRPEICRFSQSGSPVSVPGDAKHLCEQSNDRDHNPDADKPIDHYFYMVHVNLLVVRVDEDVFPAFVKKGQCSCDSVLFHLRHDDLEIPLSLVFGWQRANDHSYRENHQVRNRNTVIEFM